MKKEKKLVIYGVGETADIAYEYFTHDSPYEVIAFTADAAYKKSGTHLGLPVINFAELEKIHPPGSVEVFAAATYNKLNRVRTKMYNAVKSERIFLRQLHQLKSICMAQCAAGRERDDL